LLGGGSGTSGQVDNSVAAAVVDVDAVAVVAVAHVRRFLHFVKQEFDAAGIAEDSIAGAAAAAHAARGTVVNTNDVLDSKHCVLPRVRC